MSDLGEISIQLNPAATIGNVLKIATKEVFEIEVSVLKQQPVNYTFQFGESDRKFVATDKGYTKVTHVYSAETDYNISINASVFGYTEQRFVHVIAKPCGPPAIYFPNIYKEHDPQIVTRGSKIDFLKVNLEKQSECSQGEPYYLWNISPAPTAAISEADKQKEAFVLQPRSLDNGNYSVTLNISYGKEKYWFETYIRVVSSPLVAFLSGGSFREVNSNLTKLTLDALKSFDPDQKESSGLNFEWSCKFDNNSFPPVPDEICNSTEFVKIPDTESAKDVIRLDTSKFREVVIYTFKVTVTKDSRETSVQQRVSLLPNIPQLEIRLVASFQ